MSLNVKFLALARKTLMSKKVNFKELPLSCHLKSVKKSCKVNIIIDINWHKINLKTEYVHVWIQLIMFFSSERKQWLIGLCSGCAVVYMARAVVPLCIVSISKEFSWSKTDSVCLLTINKVLPLFHVYTIRFFCREPCCQRSFGATAWLKSWADISAIASEATSL